MKKYFLTGLVILLPVALTAMIILFLFDFFTGPFVPIVSLILLKLESIFQFSLPKGLVLITSRILSLILLCLLILLLGWIARWFLITNLFRLIRSLIARIPLVSSIYKVSRDIFSALFSSDGKKAFKHPVISPFPFPPSYGLGFQAGEVAAECQEMVKTPLVSVFMPTSPHPISGFLFLAPEKDVKKIDMSNEDAVKFLVSCGLVHPDSETMESSDELI